MKKYLVLAFVFISLLVSSCTEYAEETEKVLPSGNYISSSEPDSTARIFMPGFISNQLAERDAAFSPDMDEFFYTIWLSTRRGVIMHVVKEDSIWKEPVPASFSGVYNDIEPAFSPDGKRLYFASTRPLSDSIQTNDYNIWYVEKQENIWSDPISAGTGINTARNEFYPSVTNDGTIYFTRHLGVTEIGEIEKLFYSPLIEGGYTLSFELEENVNFTRLHFNSFIDPDEKFLIYSAHPGKDNYGGGDMYISFKEDGKWLEAKNLGASINSPFLDYCPYITPDGKYFFFSSGKVSESNQSKEFKTYQDVLDLNNANENGNSDVYWISADFIEKLK